MKYLVGILIAIAIIFLSVFFYQNKIAPEYYKNRLKHNSIYNKIKYDIKQGTSRKEVYEILKKKGIEYHEDKNRNIDITGQGVTIEISNTNEVYRVAPH